MKLITRKNQLKEEIKIWEKEALSIALVPTMGYLHTGHESLIKKAKEENEKVVVSIFVNPMQFNSKEDLENYPTNLENDMKILEKLGVDILFAPSKEEIYPQENKVFIELKDLDKELCGATRPGHFQGVCTIVAKLFNLIKPARAYFGKKDFQQLAIIKKMVEDLDFSVGIIPCDTVRTNKGLALSSRNSRLNSNELEDALILYKSLEKVEEEFKKGEKNTERLIEIGKSIIGQVESAKIDYISIVDAETLEKIEEIKSDSLIALGVFIGNVRLIDNRELFI